jgi:hypothetical protein
MPSARPAELPRSHLKADGEQKKSGPHFRQCAEHFVGVNQPEQGGTEQYPGDDFADHRRLPKALENTPEKLRPNEHEEEFQQEYFCLVSNDADRRYESASQPNKEKWDVSTEIGRTGWPLLHVSDKLLRDGAAG